MKFGKVIAYKISNELDKRKINVNKFATENGIAPSTLKAILKGNSNNSYAITLIIIANALGMTTAEFFSDPNLDYSKLDIHK